MAAAALGELHLGAGEQVAAGGGHVHGGMRAPRQHLRLAPEALLQRQRDRLPRGLRARPASDGVSVGRGL